MGDIISLYQGCHPDIAIQNIVVAELHIHMKLRVARASGMISAGYFRKSFDWHADLFKEGYSDIEKYRRDYPFYFPKLLDMKERFYTEVAEGLSFPVMSTPNTAV